MCNAIIHAGVEFLGEKLLGPFVVVGQTPRDEDVLVTVIGAQAIIRSHSVIYAGNKIGARFQTGHNVLVRESNEIGDDVSVGTGSVVEHHVKIGNAVRLHSHVFVPEYSILDEGCWLGPNVVLTNAKYPRSPDVKDNLVGPCIGRNAKLGANVTVLPGVNIGPEALVGAGAVIVADVPPRAVVVGNPGRVINTIEELPYE